MRVQIQPTKDEQELFELLRNTVKKVAPGTSLRVAGGWVRDNLLGKKSNDIDFMVDNMSGEQIARLITNELGLSGPHVVQANPDASKHLETAGAEIPISNGKVFDLDFAIARQEIYHDDSRIPEIKPATPEEDAFRRDLTINSMFYNIMTGELEDFTGRGMEDLKSRTIKTPEDPLKTFKDDPLRIFRTIRFASRYNGNIDPETLSAMNNPELHSEIREKVSKERIQEELFKTMKGPNPLMAINLLKETGIFRDIIEDAVKGSKFEGKIAPLDMEQNNPHHELTVWGHTLKVVENLLMYYPDTDPEKRAIMILTAVMHDLGKLYYDIHVDKGDQTSYYGHADASGEIAEMIMRYLKFNNKMIDQVSKMSKHHMRVHLVENDKNLSGEGKRLAFFRKFIRKMLAEGIDAMDIMNLSIADAYSKGHKIVDPSVVKNYQLLKTQLEQALASISVDQNQKKVVPVLNGREIMTILNINPGCMVGDATRFVYELMDENPKITKDEAAERLVEEFAHKIDNEEKIRQASACPKHLLFSKIDEIKEAINDENCDRAITIMTTLKKENEDDESVYAEIANRMLDVLLIDRSKRNFELLGYVFDKAIDNFFDVEVCIPVLGILLLLKTGTKEEHIETLCERMKNMANDKLQVMLKKLPDDAYHKKFIKRLKNGRCNCK